MDFVSVRGRMMSRRKSVAHSSHSGTSHLIIGSAATEPFFFSIGYYFGGWLCAAVDGDDADATFCDSLVVHLARSH